MKYALSEIGSPGDIHHTTVILLATGHIVKDFFIIFDKQAGWELTKIFENDKMKTFQLKVENGKWKVRAERWYLKRHFVLRYGL